MKNIAKIIAAGSVLFALAACSHVAKYTTYDFVAIAASSYTVNESTTTLVIPVCAYPENGETNTTVTFDVKDGSAVAGTDYTFSPANGVLNFSGEKAQSITITIMGHPGEFTGDKKFTVELKDASNNYEMNSYTKATVTIKDEDHPLTDLFGAYEMAAECYDGEAIAYPKWTMNIGPYEGDVTKIWIDNPTAFTVAFASYTGNSPVYAVVSSDKKTITIPLPQKTTGDLSAFGLDNIYIFAHEGFEGGAGKYITDEAEVVFTLQDDGRWITTDCFGAGHPDDLAEYPSLFYNYCVNYSTLDPTKPTYFVKK